MQKKVFDMHRYNNSVKINLKKIHNYRLGAEKITTNIQTKKEMHKKAYQFYLYLRRTLKETYYKTISTIFSKSKARTWKNCKLYIKKPFNLFTLI